MRIKYVQGISKGLEQVVPDGVGRQLIESGMAVEAAGSKPAAVSEGAGGVDVNEFIRAAQAEEGEWIRTSEVLEGDKFIVHGRGEIDRTTFDRPYIVLPVIYHEQERMLRLGVRNAERLRKAFGSNTTQWVGREIRVTAIEPVPGLTKQRGVEVRRMILDGVA